MATPILSARAEERISPIPTKSPMILQDIPLAASRAPRNRAATLIWRHSPEMTERQRPDIQTTMATEEPSRKSAQTDLQSVAPNPSRQIHPHASMTQALQSTFRAASVPLQVAPCHEGSPAAAGVIQGMGRTSKKRKPKAAIPRGPCQAMGIRPIHRPTSASGIIPTIWSSLAIKPMGSAKAANARQRAVGCAPSSNGKREAGAAQPSCPVTRAPRQRP
jgi:hypothetical protein